MKTLVALSFGLLLLAGCGQSRPTAPPSIDPLAPSERAQLIQDRLAGHIAYLYTGPFIVWWVWETDRYEFGQTFGNTLIAWEKGEWWIQTIGGQDYLVFEIIEGGQLIQTDTGPQWRYYTPPRRRIPFTLLGTSLQDPGLQLEMDVGRRYTYKLAHPDSLEAIRAHRLP